MGLKLKWGKTKTMATFGPATAVRTLPPAKVGGYAFTSVCLSICLSVYERVLMNVFGGLEHGPMNNRLALGGAHDLDPDVFKGLFIY